MSNKKGTAQEAHLSPIDRHVARGIVAVLAIFIEAYNVFLDTMADQTIRIISALRS